jgi:hypothetical protein
MGLQTWVMVVMVEISLKEDHTVEGVAQGLMK